MAIRVLIKVKVQLEYALVLFKVKEVMLSQGAPKYHSFLKFEIVQPKKKKKKNL